MAPGSFVFLSTGDANRADLRSREFGSGFAGVCQPRNHRSSDISQIRCRLGDRIAVAADLVRLDRVTNLCERRFQIPVYVVEKMAIRSWRPSHERLNESSPYKWTRLNDSSVQLQMKISIRSWRPWREPFQLWSQFIMHALWIYKNHIQFTIWVLDYGSSAYNVKSIKKNLTL